MTEITPEKIRQFLDLPLDQPNDSGETTARGYLLRLLADVWRDGEGFNGKRPFGNSGWEGDLHLPMIRDGLVDGRLDSDGYIEAVDERQADELVYAAIAALDAPREDAPGSEPAKVIVVTEESGRERRYSAEMFGTLYDGSGTLVVGDGGSPGDPLTRVVAVYAKREWKFAREDGAEVPDATARALGIAKRALQAIRAEAEKRGDAEFFGVCADNALGEIFTETEA